MAHLRTGSRPVSPVPEGLSGGHQLVVAGLHRGGHSAQLWDDLDAGHRWVTDDGRSCLVLLFLMGLGALGALGALGPRRFL